MIMHAHRGTVLRNVFAENENDYRGSTLQVALEPDVPFIELNMKSYYGVYNLLNLRAFDITETELKLMAAAAITGLSNNPNTGNNIPAATGTPRAL